MTEAEIIPIATRSFLKWAGSKHRHIPLLRSVMPKGKRLIEPFAGSGVVSLNLEFSNYLLGEANSDLIRLYSYLQNEGDTFIKYCRRYFVPENNCKSAYILLRQRFNECKNLRERAAIFLYLNRHGYNGLCRYNSSGKYNVPFGEMKEPKIPEDRIQLFKQRLQMTELICQDFTTTMRAAKKGDVIYCDPPYVPLSPTAKFCEYSSGSFGEAEQVELAELAQSLAKRGIPVLISNHDTEYTRKLYRKAKLTQFPVPRFISCKGTKRVPVLEVLAIFA